MRYSFTVNQKASLELGIDLIDSCLFTIIKDCICAPGLKGAEFQGKYWKWVSYKLIMEEAPILGITTKRGLTKRIEKLKNAGLVESFVNAKDNSKTYFTAGPRFHEFDYEGVNSRTPTLERRDTPGVNSRSTNPSTLYPITKKVLREESVKSQEKEPKRTTIKQEPVNISSPSASSQDEDTPPPPPAEPVREGYGADGYRLDIPQELRLSDEYLRTLLPFVREAHRARVRAYTKGLDWRSMPGPKPPQVA